MNFGGRIWRYILVGGLILSSAIAALRLMGRHWWCQAADVRIFNIDIVTEHNSQHLFDPYTLTHVLHGILLYFFLWLLVGKQTTAVFRGVLALGLESAWEVFENTSFVIERYRENTIALGYYGDSIVNSIGDISAAMAGYALAMLVPAWASLASFVAIEGLLLWTIHDSLLLNILMLIWPLEQIKEWQGRIP